MLSKPSQYIRPRQACEIRRQARHSYRIGHPLNRLAVIDFGWPEHGDELLPDQQLRDIRSRVRSWWDYEQRRGLIDEPLHDIRIWEAPNRHYHVNWLMSIPPDVQAEAEAVIEDRARKVLSSLASDTIHQQSIYNLNGLISYLLKGTEPDYARQTGIQPSEQGEIWFRRAVPSMSLGRTARKRDWAEGRIVNGNRARGLSAPRERRSLDARSWKFRAGSMLPGNVDRLLVSNASAGNRRKLRPARPSRFKR